MASVLDQAQIVLTPGQMRPMKVHGSFSLPSGPHLSDNVHSFLAANAGDLQVPFGADSLKLAKEVQAGDQRVLRYHHMVDGIRVFGAQTIVAVDEANQIRSLEFYAGPTRLRAPGPQDAAAMLLPEQAYEAAAASIGSFTKRLEPPPPEPVWFPTDQGLNRAFVVIIPTASPPHDWQIVVDAQTRAVLDKRDLIKKLPDGTGLIFDPNPVVTANNNTFRDPAATVGTCGFAGTAVATLNAQRVSRTLHDLTISGGNYTLNGPWCQIHNFAAPAGPNPTEASGNFSYSCTDANFNAVMVYYYIDTFQRYLQSIGITNAHAHPIQCDPLDNTATSAWFSPVDGGLHFSDSGPCKPDRATDADCMIHEYQHAIQNDLVPGWGGTNPVTHRDEAGAMGEGAGDFVACAYFADRGGGFQREVFEDWVFGPAGLRRVDGTKTYPGSWTGEVHDDGEIWSAALWNIYRAIGGDVTGGGAAAQHEAARQAMLRSLFGSYPLLMTTASMPDGAEAIMRTNATLAAYRGAHLREMLQSFHDWGILHVNAASDIYIQDDPADPGTTSYHSPTFWDSPDVWVRNSDDGGTTHQEPVAGHDNWFYARVHNRGTAPARAFVVTFNVKLWLGTEFIFPADFLPYVSAVPGFNLASGGSMVVKAKWPAALVPPVHAHACIAVSAFSPTEAIPAGAHVWEYGNLAQKNAVIQEAAAGDTVTMKFRFGNRLRETAEVMTLEMRTLSLGLALMLTGNPDVLKQILSQEARSQVEPKRPNVRLPIHVLDSARIALTQSGDAPPIVVHLAPGSAITLGDRDAATALIAKPQWTKAEPVIDAKGRITALKFPLTSVVSVPVHLPARTDVEFAVSAQVPKNAQRGEMRTVEVVQRNASGFVVGGVRMQIAIR